MSKNVLKAAILAVVLTAGAAVAQYNLNHEVASATSTITYSNRSFTINGKPTWVFAGEVEYWRIPRELWRDRLMRVKRAGYNTVSTYVEWGFHEPIQGQWHFEDYLDLDAWLALIKELGMYAIVRAGPYICAEVDLGGFPPWLMDISGKIRGNEPAYLACVDTLYQHIFPIITKHQITKGGAVVCVQIENEHYPAGGEYQNHLVAKAKALGMEVPYIWSSLYNGSSYDPGLFPVLGAQDNKAFTTEQWMGWISLYGEPSASDANKYNHHTWTMVAAGTAGVSHYMALGGTNFGYTASLDQRVTSYDYGAQIGELGQLRPVLMVVKQTGWLINTFSPIVANSTNGSGEINAVPSGFTSWAQTGTGGKIAFVANGNTGTASLQLTWKNKNVTVPSGSNNWSVEANKFAHFLADVPITTNATLDYSASGVMGLKKFGTKNYIVLYATPGNTGGDIAFVYGTAPATAPAAPWSWNATAKRASLRFTYPTTDTVNEVVLDEGTGQTINLLIMSNATSNKTWITDSCIASGADYYDENNNLQFPAAGGRAFVFSKNGMQIVTKGATTAPTAKSLATGWSWIAVPEISATYNDANWQQSTNPQDMPAYKWPNGYGWYRATYNANAAGNATLTIRYLRGTVFTFVNGAFASSTSADSNATQSITLKQGANSISILACAAQRDKLWNTFDYIPPHITKSGFWGTVTIGGATVSPWRFRGGFEGVDESPFLGNITAASWTALLAKTWSTGTPQADNVPRLWRVDFTYTPPANALQTWTLSGTVTAGTQGVVWLNGHCLGRQITSQPALFAPECWLAANNTVILLTHSGAAPQGYSLQSVEYHSFATSPVTGVSPKNSMKANLEQKLSVTSALVNTGNHFSLPSGFAGKNGSIAIYDLQGHMVVKNVTVRNGVPIMPKGKMLQRGIFIAKSEK